MRGFMLLIGALLALPLLAMPQLAVADPYTDNAAVDELMAQLRVATSEAEADDLSSQIWSYWFNPSDRELARRMTEASYSMSVGDLISALATLNDVVKEYPDYSEGWNQRATVYYMIHNLTASLADIEKVLAIEPRHYGALSGRVLIYLQQGKHDEALKAMIAALAVHPYLRERKLFPELAQDVTHV